VAGAEAKEQVRYRMSARDAGDLNLAGMNPTLTTNPSGAVGKRDNRPAVTRIRVVIPERSCSDESASATGNSAGGWRWLPSAPARGTRDLLKISPRRLSI